MDYLRSLDKSLFLSINSFHFFWLDPLMDFVSGQLIWIPLLLFILWKSKSMFANNTFWIFILFAILALVSSDTTSSYIIKNLTSRLRPCRIPEIREIIYSFGQKCGGKYGFVSSHAANSMALISFTYLALKLNLKSFAWVWAFPLMVGWSRMYLGVHYPGDILGGFVVGFFFGVLFYFLFVRIKGQDAEASSENFLLHS